MVDHTHKEHLIYQLYHLDILLDVWLYAGVPLNVQSLDDKKDWYLEMLL